MTMMQNEREKMTRTMMMMMMTTDSNNGYHHHHGVYNYYDCSHASDGSSSCDFSCNGKNNYDAEEEEDKTPPPPPPNTTASSSFLTASLSPPYKHNNNNNKSIGFIEHPVSKFDTLAGIAIKYGVEVSDIKKMNGLVTDLQMFALKSLQIPLPGRHPPSPCLSDASSSERTPPHRRHSDLFDSFQSLRLNPSQQKVSRAMSSLQGYYGLTPTRQTNPYEGLEMAPFQKGDPPFVEDSQYLKPSPVSQSPLSHHRKSRSLVGFPNEDNRLIHNMHITEPRESDNEKYSDKFLRRRLKSEADFNSHSPELLMRNDDNSRDASLAITGKGLALRSKATSRNTLPLTDSGAGGLASIPIAPGDSLVADNGFSGVRKSSSTSSLQDQDGNSSSLWPTSKWSLAPDLQALTAATIARPIFDGLPKPLTGRRNKAALD
uniref:LysM domain-containing protein n=1 Tax=Rhizophora mucronata TaxID=61149 RepID=A0A2P2MZM3_RHIMU